MKLAIIGQSPLALEACLRFHLHGAALTWFIDEHDPFSFDSFSSPKDTFTSDLGLGILKEINLTYSPEKFSWDEWINGYQKPLLNYLKAHQEVKYDEIVSISKRFLAPGELISGKSRFHDLFRVIFRVNPKDFIDDQKETNPETYKRLTEEFISSLASSIEMYQDYDLVLDLRTDLGKASAAVTGRALGEGRISQQVAYGKDALLMAKKSIPSQELREIAIIGSDSLAAEMLLSLDKWIEEPRSNLFIVTTEEDPFESFVKNANEETLKKLNHLFKKIEVEYENEINDFTMRLREWQELDDFIKVKKPKPAEPIPRLNYFSGHNVTAIDELIDRKRMFLTLEKPDFRTGKKHPENNHLDLKTIGVDQVFVAHAKKDKSILHLDKEEKGFFELIPTRPNINTCWEGDLKKLEGIEDEVFKLFSPLNSL